MYEMLLITGAALLPVIVALIIIYRKDKSQPEPISQLLKAFFFGVLSAPLSFLISCPFAAIGLYNNQSLTLFGQLGAAFFGAAIPEEIFKLIMLWLAVRHNKYFDEHFDGIVYAVCVGMGFAGIENVMYLFGNYEEWISVGISRALLSIPGHFFFAILMGYFYSLAHFTQDSSRKSTCIFWTIAAPILAHGIYDGILMVWNITPEMSGLFTIALIYFMNVLRKKTKGHMANLLKKDGII